MAVLDGTLTQVVVAVLGVLFWGGLLAWSVIRDARALRNGFLMIVFAYYVLGFAVFLVSRPSVLKPAVEEVSIVLAAIVAMGLLTLPLILVADGVLMLRRERHSVGNELSLVVGLALLLLPVVLIVLLRYDSRFTDSLAVSLLAAQACVSACFLAFAAQTALYAWIARGAEARAVIVLGSGLVRGSVSPLLAARLERGMAAARERETTGARVVLVPSGGRGGDEPRPEGEVMGEWLREHGVADSDLLVEDRARTTRENLVNSVRLLERHGVPAPYLAVTNNYHAPRTAMLARKLDVDAQVIGAPTAWYFWPSAYLREFVAAMLDHRALMLLCTLAVVTITVLTWLSLSPT